MNDPNEPPPLPAFVGYPIFPFEGDLRVKPLDPPLERDHVRSGEPQILPGTPADVWERNLDVVATEMAKRGGRAINPRRAEQQD